MQKFTYEVNITLYTCNATVYLTGDDQRIESITGNHLAGKGNNDVQGFYIRYQWEVKKAPNDLYKFFPNIESITFSQTGIDYLDKEHLHGLSKLWAINYFNNSITSIGNDLFESQPNTMQRIEFFNSPIEHIGYNVFSQMSKLTTLYITGTPCGITAIDNQTYIASQIPIIIQQCPPSRAMIQEELLNDVSKCTDDRLELLLEFILSEDGSC